MLKLFNPFCVALAMVSFPGIALADMVLQKEMFTLIADHCLDCHDSELQRGDLNLETLEEVSVSLRHRNVWKSAYDMIEAGMMPPPKRKTQPSPEERKKLLHAIDQFLALPDPDLGTRDPGKPVLRRLNRLEYNNTVRDLLGLDLDIFMFSERQPIVKDYFKPKEGQLPERLEINVREYGQRYPVLLPQAGLPLDNRAAHGFNNRGDAMNVSPLQLEKYVSLAGEIVHEPTLPFRSQVFADLIGVDPATLPMPEVMKTSVGIKASEAVDSVDLIAPNDNVSQLAAGSAYTLETFREMIQQASKQGRGGNFDVPAGFNNQVIPGKGGLIRVNLSGSKQCVMNPNEDLWLAAFSTAMETSGDHLIANKNKGEKKYEIELSVRNGDKDEGIVSLGICMLSRRGESGEVNVTITYSDQSTQSLKAVLQPGDGQANTLFTFQAPEGLTMKLLSIDGSNFSGDYILADDVSFITNGIPREPQQKEAPNPKLAAKSKPKTKTFPPPRVRLGPFLEKAFRSPVSDGEIDRYMSLFETQQSQGMPASEAMKTTLQAILSSPRFLFVQEQHHSSLGSVRPLSDHEIASRLSYFLWSTSPDEDLLKLAKKGTLKDPQILVEQVKRMLRDPKVRELSESFAIQWLRLDQLYTSKPDPKQFKQFYADIQGKNTLHASMLVEALLLFETVLIEDRSVLDLLAADYTWLNIRLAKLYGLESSLRSASWAEKNGSTGPATQQARETPEIGKKSWFRVPLTDSLRGGVLMMAAPLTVTSLPFRTSPVKRGAWILETIFNRPPPEPKVAFVLKESEDQQAEPATVREMFERHRSEPACYTCHTRLDPPGFALEAFNPIGAWREKDGEQPVDASGQWNMEAYSGPRAFKSLLLEDSEAFVRGFTEHLLSYALGRKLAYHDQKIVHDIVQSQRAHAFHLSGIITEIVTSYPFLNVRNEPAKAP